MPDLMDHHEIIAYARKSLPLSGEEAVKFADAFKVVQVKERRSSANRLDEATENYTKP